MPTRDERLSEDHERMERLQEISNGWFTFQVDRTWQEYLITLRCKGICMRAGAVKPIWEHRVGIRLGPGYHTQPPDLSWQTPIFHPNIFSYGVCLLARWGTETKLDDVCVWLWDMARYRLYNLESTLDKAAVNWVKQHEAELPLDSRDLRALITGESQPSQPPAQSTHDFSSVEILDLIRIWSKHEDEA
jgi:ubiquitin-protein ligase